MWPWTHAAFGYLLYAVYLRVGERPRPLGPAVVLLGLGTQLPDLIDKPLAWYLDILPYGRSFAHSLVTGVPFVMLPVSAYLYWRDRRALAIAFSLGYLSHLAGDGWHAVVRSTYANLNYLAWPLLPPPPGPETEGLIAHLSNIQGSPEFLVGLFLTALAFGLWVRRGTPGLVTLRDWALGRSGRL